MIRGADDPFPRPSTDQSRRQLLKLWDQLSPDSQNAVLRTALIMAHSEGLISDEEAAGDGAIPQSARQIFSLGGHCYTSHLLKQMGLRYGAGPFDWLFSDPRMVADCLDDHFQAFLNPAFYTYTGNPSGLGRGHLHYSPKYQRPVIFNHHDPLKPEDHEHFCRAVERIEAVLNGEGRSLFVAVLDIHRGKEPNIQLMFEALRRRNSQAELLVMVGSATASEQPSASLIIQRDGLQVFRVETTSLMQGGLAHQNPADDQIMMDLIRRQFATGLD
jgi:hypothetical protein